MRNISIQGIDISLNFGKCYYVIDALYLNSIKFEVDNLDKRIFDKEIEEKIFPYAYAPFAKITAKSIFQVRGIKKVKYEEINPKEKNYFSSDTGLILFIMNEIFIEFLENYDYNILTESITEIINFSYWDNIVSKFERNDLGLILAPGIDSEYEFDGSGIYKIET